MNLSFVKYHGTGNDFIMIDNRLDQVTLSREQIEKLCHRRFGIGADGLILLNSHPAYDFQMIYYNSDGRVCSMCGNGGRALVQFAADLGIQKDHYRFLAIDGEHEAFIKENRVELKMQNVNGVQDTPVGIQLDTGSPHLVIKTSNVLAANIVEEGRKLRYSPRFAPGGVNVNFIEFKGPQLLIRTYERGVEDETFSCGTGAVAAAIAGTLPGTAIGEKKEVHLKAPGGELNVRFYRTAKDQFEDVWLIGGATRVFAGQLQDFL